MSVRVVVGDTRDRVRDRLPAALACDPGMDVELGVDDPVQTLERGREINANVVVLGSANGSIVAGVCLDGDAEAAGRRRDGRGAGAAATLVATAAARP